MTVLLITRIVVLGLTESLTAALQAAAITTITVAVAVAAVAVTRLVGRLWLTQRAGA